MATPMPDLMATIIPGLMATIIPGLMATISPGFMATIGHVDNCADPRVNQHAAPAKSAESIIVYFDPSFSECGDTCDSMTTLMVDLMRVGARTGRRADHCTDGSFKESRYINLYAHRQP